MRFERSALYANENGYAVYATTLGISRWKDMKQINDHGHRAAKRYEQVIIGISIGESRRFFKND